MTFHKLLLAFVLVASFEMEGKTCRCFFNKKKRRHIFKLGQQNYIIDVGLQTVIGNNEAGVSPTPIEKTEK